MYPRDVQPGCIATWLWDSLEARREDPIEEHPLRHGAVPLRDAVDDDAWDCPHVHGVRELRELRRLDRGCANPRRGECGLVRQQHGRRAVRSSRRDEDVDHDVAVEGLEALERIRRERRAATAGFADRADERRELVAPREPVVDDAPVLPCGEDCDCWKHADAGWVVLAPVRNVLRDGGEAFDDAFRFGAEVDVARAGERSLLGAVGDDELHRTLELVEELPHLRLVLRPEDRHAYIFPRNCRPASAVVTSKGGEPWAIGHSA